MVYYQGPWDGSSPDKTNLHTKEINERKINYIDYKIMIYKNDRNW